MKGVFTAEARRRGGAEKGNPGNMETKVKSLRTSKT